MALRWASHRWWLRGAITSLASANAVFNAANPPYGACKTIPYIPLANAGLSKLIAARTGCRAWA